MDLLYFGKIFQILKKNWSLDKKLSLTKERITKDSKFRVKITDVYDNGSIRIIPSRFSNPVFEYPNLKVENYKATCQFKYLVILDLEATCDYSPNPSVNFENAEIIEFPWVVIDTEKLEIIYEKQLFVRPENIDGVTHFATKLTGITKETVKEAEKLNLIIEKFDTFIRDMYNGDKKLFRLVTDGIWDLQIQLRNESEKKEYRIKLVV